MQRLIYLIIMLLIFIAQPALAAQLAGEVTVAMGDAQVVASVTGQRAAVQGLPLHVGDILQTGAGGHIHMRMVDDALVSLRPNSKLKITSYTYQPGVAAATQIRFDLMQGTVRSVTGKGGEQAKDRFRMNTPVAAIGVRGTDFIVQTDAETTLVNVQSGAIVLAPLGEGCRAAVLGPCQTAAARVLTAGTQNMMLKFNRGADEPKLVPLGEGLQIQPAPEQRPQARPVAPDAEKVQVDSAKQAMGTLPAVQQAPQPVVVQSAPQPVVQPAPQPVSPAPQLVALPVPEPVIQLPVHYQMAWGRWSGASSGNDLGRAYQDAANGREVTVGNEMAGLFRDNTSPFSLPLNGNTEFALRESQVAMLNSGVAGKVQNGTLGVSFNTQTFTTQLNIQHPALANAVTLSAYGALRGSDGMLYSLAKLSNGSVVGALSRDGTEAGYLFQLPTVAGTLAGTTLWAK